MLSLLNTAVLRVSAAIANLRVRDEERGQTALEYALFGGLLAVAIITVAALIIEGSIANPFQTLLNGIQGCVDFDSGTDCSPFPTP